MSIVLVYTNYFNINFNIAKQLSTNIATEGS